MSLALKRIDPDTGEEKTYLNEPAYREKIQTEPEWFVRRILYLTYWSKQVETIEAVRDHRRVSLSGCTASSKTMAAAITLHWWLQAYRPARVITIAPSLRQVEMNIWGYAHSIWKKSAVPLGGEFLTTNYRPGASSSQEDKEWYATGFSTNDPERVRGIHGPRDLIIVDDAQGVPQEIMLALENAMASGLAHLLLLFNKSKLSGEAFESCHSKAHLYHRISIPASETPNLKAGRIVIPGMIAKEFVDESIKTYGWDSDFVRVMIRDEFAKQEPDTLIPIDWYEQAMRREIDPKEDTDKIVDCGLDVARMGDDSSVLCPIRGRTCLPLTAWNKKDGPELVDDVYPVLISLNASTVGVDSIGVGSGPYDLLKRKKGFRTYPVEANRKTSQPNKFYDFRSELWWLAREALDSSNPNCLRMPNNKRLMGQLTTAKYRIEKNLIRIESKDEMKARMGGQSPDEADAFCNALWMKKLRIKQAISPPLATIVVCD